MDAWPLQLGLCLHHTYQLEKVSNLCYFRLWSWRSGKNRCWEKICKDMKLLKKHTQWRLVPQIWNRIHAKKSACGPCLKGVVQLSGDGNNDATGTARNCSGHWLLHVVGMWLLHPCPKTGATIGSAVDFRGKYSFFVILSNWQVFLFFLSCPYGIMQ